MLLLFCAGCCSRGEVLETEIRHCDCRVQEMEEVLQRARPQKASGSQHIRGGIRQESQDSATTFIEFHY